MEKRVTPIARILVCANEKGPGKSQCLMGEGEKMVLWLKEQVKKRNLREKLWVSRTKCLGFCEAKGTVVIFQPTNEQFSAVRFEEIPEKFESFLKELNL